jgi:hypothetical protein
MKLLVSWVAFNNDFIGNQVDTDNSPNYHMHKYFYHRQQGMISG